MTQLALPFVTVIEIPPYRMTWREGEIRKVIYVTAHTVNL